MLPGLDIDKEFQSLGLSIECFSGALNSCKKLEHENIKTRCKKHTIKI